MQTIAEDHDMSELKQLARQLGERLLQRQQRVAVA